MSDPFIDQVLDTVGDQATGRSLPRALTPFRTPAYRWLAASVAFGAFAQGVWVIGLVWEVFRLGGGATQLSLVTGASAVGVMVPALLAGVVADRLPQKRILLTVAGVEALGMALVAGLAWADATGVVLLSVVTFVVGMAMAFYYPAYSAMLPSLVPEQDLMAVNGFEGMVRPTIGQALGPAVAGAVIGWIAPSAAFTVAALAMVGSLLALSRVPRVPVRHALDAEHAGHPVRSALADMGEGLRYMVRTPWLLASLLFASLLILSVMGPLEVLLPFVIKSELGGDAGDHSLVLASFGIGGAAGSLVMASRRMPRRYLTVMTALWGMAGLPFLVVAHADAVWQMVAAGFVMGIFFSAPMVIWGTLLQRRVPPHLLGRVSSLDFFVSISLMPVSMALAGPLAEAIGTRATFYAAALSPVLIAVVTVLWARLPADEVAHPLD
ncbi:MFS transporter [Nocardioides campestrisoli]|uniref:MFS transporter n=1 Tax=Nocardioides campestrisoli TaxID=2736757 RepID=UPI001CD1AFA4|nr:MFS transporter [Nocardioides campestrisoli]